MEPAKRNKLLYFIVGTVALLGLIGVTVGLVLLFTNKSSFSFEEIHSEEITRDFLTPRLRPLWGWRCEEKRCVKYKLTADNNSTAIGLQLCRLHCNENNDIGTLWPKPSGFVQVSNDVVKIDPTRIIFNSDNFKSDSIYWPMAQKRFRDMQLKKIPSRNSQNSGDSELVIEVIAESNEMSEAKKTLKIEKR